MKIVPDEKKPQDETSDYRHHLDIDAGRIHRELGYTQPVSLADALQRTIAWERANP